MEVCDNSLRSILASCGGKPLHQDRALLYLIPLSIFYKRKAARMSYEMQEKSVDVDNLMQVIATAWRGVLQLVENEEEQNDLIDSVRLFATAMSNYDIEAHWEFLEDDQKKRRISFEPEKLISESVQEYLQTKFPWQQNLEELVERKREFVITEEMIKSQKSPPKKEVEKPQATVATPPRVLNLLRNMR